MALFSLKMRRLTLPLLSAACCLRMHGDLDRSRMAAGMSLPSAMPQMVVRAWEEPADLRSAPSGSVGAAYLDETLLLGKPQDASSAAPNLFVRSRPQPLAVAPGASIP
jgi:hypothetical protein